MSRRASGRYDGLSVYRGCLFESVLDRIGSLVGRGNVREVPAGLLLGKVDPDPFGATRSGVYVGFCPPFGSQIAAYVGN